jgi:hypothetical protein
LWGLAKLYTGFDVDDNGIALTFKKSDQNQIKDAFRQIIMQTPAVEELATKFTLKAHEKYEGFLSEKLQTQLFAKNSMDLEGALRLINNSFNF